MKTNSRKAVFEFLSIVIAVVLAMTLTEWRQEYLNKKLAQQSFENIVAEIEENLSSLKGDSALISRDREFLSNWVVAYRNESDTLPSLQTSFRLSILSTAAWEVAKVNQSLTHLSNQQNMDMAALYGLQQFYSVKASQVFDLMGQLQALASDQRSDEFYQAVQRLRYHLNLVFNTVRGYINATEEVLALYTQPEE